MRLYELSINEAEIKNDTIEIELAYDFLEMVKGDIDKLNKRAAAKTMNTVSLVVSQPYSNKKGDKVVKISIDSKPVKIKGYTFIGKVELEDGIPFVAPVPGQELPDWVRNADPLRCDHCNKRRTRMDCFYVRNDETGEVLQIGRNCLKDYLGIDATRILHYWKWLSEFKNELDEIEEDADRYGSEGRFIDYEKVGFVLALSDRIIKKVGWVSKRDALDFQKQSTADHVFSYLHPYTKYDQKFKDEIGPIETSNEEVAEKVMEWILSFENDENLNDYKYNLLSMVKNKFISRKRIPFLVSAIASYNKHIEGQQKKQDALKGMQGSQHVGTVGERSDYELVVTGVKYIDGSYGVVTLVSFKDNAGNIFKWFASGSKEFDIGTTYHVTATVKKHDEYEGIKQTYLTRVKLK